MRLSLKLAIICALAAAFPLMIASVFIVRQISARINEKGIERLQAEERAAAGLYAERLAEMRAAAQTLADEIANRSLLGADSAAGTDNQARAKLQDLLSSERDQLSLDFLIVADPAGHVIARQNDSPKRDEMIAGQKVGEDALAAGARLQPASIAGSAVEGSEFLSRMWLNKAAKIEGSPLDQALVIEAAAPILNGGRFLGVVFVGQMLNNYYVARPGGANLQIPFVTEVRRDVYNDSDAGGALVALGDTIIASSLFMPGSGEPLLRGTKCNPDQGVEEISDGGHLYAVCWRPMKSLTNSRAGGIGTAVPIERLSGGLTETLAALAGAVIVALCVAALIGFSFGSILSRRLNTLTDAVSRMSVGELSNDVRERLKRSSSGSLLGRLPSFRGNGNDNGTDPAANSNNSDEIGRLAAQLEQMRESFRMAIERLRRR
jgi:HAMP domain-containing protein